MPDFDRLASEARQGSRTVRHKKQKSRKRFNLPWQRWFDLAVALLLFATAVYFFTNPFIDTALGTAQAAQPVTSTEIPILPTMAWCLVGSAFGDEADPLPLFDDGSNGDWAAGDGVFVLEAAVVQSGQHSWQVQACEDETIHFPSEMSWLQTAQANENVFFTFDTNNRDYFGNQYFPHQFIHHAYDDTAQFTAVGSFQEWNNSDPNTTLTDLGDETFRLMYRVPAPGDYEGHIVVTGTDAGYGANGRSVQPASFQFTTDTPNQRIFFMLDQESGQMSILYNPRGVYNFLAFGGGAYIIAVLLLLIAAAFVLRVVRYQLIHDPRRHVERPCPQCGHPDPKRVRRSSSERLISTVLRMPMRRYQCRTCGWSGNRFDQHHLL